MATRQVDDTPTEPTITPEQRNQLKSASKTVKLDNLKTELATKPLAGNALIKNHTTVVFALIGTEVLLPVPISGRVVIGRVDDEMSETADIDLTAYGGLAHGVSRRHAVLYRTRITVSLADLNSTNGTYLNGIKMTPHQPRLLREGDEVCFGNMRFHISFGG